MHRTQLLLPRELHQRAAEAARARRVSLGSLVRDALVDYLARTGDGRPSDAALDDLLLARPYDDPTPDASLSLDADHYLYGTPRRSRRRR